LKISKFNVFRWISIALMVSAAVLLVLQLIQFSRLRAGFPPGTHIAGVAVGGLNQQQAAQRITEAYNRPIELVYNDQRIHVKPSQIGFKLDIEKMIAAADQQRVTLPFWSSFWDYLWNEQPESRNTILSADIEENRIRSYLMKEISSRYDQPPKSSRPVAGSDYFVYGNPGDMLDIERSLPLIIEALRSPYNRTVLLIVSEVEPPRPSLENLEVLIKQIIDKNGYDGLTELYVLDLENREEINFAYELGEEYDPGIAFTAASAIKIPILVSAYRVLEEPTPAYAAELIEGMIKESDNEMADELMETYLDRTLGPILVTENMQAIGLENTFLGGHFYPGAPLLRRYSTPANNRLDYDTDPDVYNQTTTADMGMLLDDIYQCAKTNGGTLKAVFGDEISQSECQYMITYLTMNKTGHLLDTDLPGSTQFAHKHGWVAESDGVTRTAIDAGIFFTRGGDYIVVLGLYQPTQLISNVADALSFQISRAIYNYFNIS